MTTVLDACKLCKQYLAAQRPTWAKQIWLTGGVDVEYLNKKSIQSNTQISILLEPFATFNIAENFGCTLDGAFGAFVVARHAGDGSLAGMRALAAAQDIAKLLHGQNFKDEALGLVRLESCEPVLEIAYFQKGFGIWIVKWRQVLYDPLTEVFTNDGTDDGNIDG